MTSSPDLFDLPASVKYDIDCFDKYEYGLVEDDEMLSKSYHSFAEQNMKLQQENHRQSITISSLQTQIKNLKSQFSSQQQTITQLQQQLNIQQSIFDNKFNGFLNCANDYDQKKTQEIQILKQEKQSIYQKYTDLKAEFNQYRTTIFHNNDTINISPRHINMNNNQDYKSWKWFDVYRYIIHTINDHRLKQYDTILFNSLKEQNITGQTLSSLNDDDLYYLGIKNNFDRNILLDYIHKLITGISITITDSVSSTNTPTTPSDFNNNNISNEHKHKSLSIQQLKQIRIRQQNIVYVVGLPVSLCNAKLLKSAKWFGKFGEISRICFNTSPKCVKANSIPTFVTYTNEYNALQAIQKMNLYCLVDGTRLKTNYGRTKYCPQFCQGQQCLNDKCKFLHQYAKYDDIITEQEINDFNAIRAGPPSRFNKK